MLNSKQALSSNYTAAKAQAHAAGSEQRTASLAPSASRPPMPAHAPWAWAHYQRACANAWQPADTDLSADITQWHDSQALSDDERHIVKRVLGFFVAADTLVADNLVFALYRHISHPDCRQFLLRQAFEESQHTHVCRHLVDALQLDSDEIFGMLKQVPAMQHKFDWLRPLMRGLAVPGFQCDSEQDERQLLRELVAFYLITEGIFCQVAFTQILSLGQRARMPGTAELFRKMLRNETGHLRFGIDLINQLKREKPALWDKGLQSELSHMIRSAVALETRCAYENMPRGILGLNAPMFEEHLQYTANCRCAEIGLAQPYPGAGNPFSWLERAAEQGAAQQKAPQQKSLDWES